MSIWSLGVFVVIAIGVATSGVVFTPGAWYERLDKPGWTPPNWLFGPVWSVLYLLIAVAGWLVWEAAGWSVALAFWAVQMVFNFAWSWLFFGRHRMDQAFIDAILMWLSILGFMLAAWPVSTLASWLFLPYLLWVTLATLLNLALWRRNPEAVASEA
jgi:tryptophan-rich sensory protein